MQTELFTEAELENLRREHVDVRVMRVDSPGYQRFCALLDKAPQPMIRQLAEANIPFASVLAKMRVKP